MNRASWMRCVLLQTMKISRKPKMVSISRYGLASYSLIVVDRELPNRVKV